MSTVGKPITCRAAVLWEPKTPLVIETVEVAVPKAREVRIKMISSGMCHSDVYFQEGRDPKYNFPVVLGHEGAGIVESVGPGVTRVKPGDKVIPVFLPNCKSCSLCKNPKTNLCEKFYKILDNNQIDGTSRITCKGKSLHQMGTISTFSEYTVTSEFSVAKLNPKAPMDKVCLVGCCVPTGYGAAVMCADVQPGSTCAIFGLGGVGMNVATGCKARKASRIIGVDTNPDKFELAKKFGCTEFVNPNDHKKPVDQVLREMTNGGLDYTFVSVGNLKAMELGFDSAHPAYGHAIMVGLADKEDKMSLSPWDLLMGKVLKGTFYGSVDPIEDIPKLVDLYLEGKILIDELITHRFPLERINESIDLMLKGKSLRSIIVYD